MAYNGRLRESGRAAARHPRHRHTELLSGPSAGRPRLSDPLDGRTAGAPRRHRPRRQRRRRHLTGGAARVISRRATCTKSTRPCQDQCDAAGQRSRRRLHDFERSERRCEAPDRGGCAAAADPRTGRGSASHDVSLLPLRNHPGGLVPRTGSARHTLSVDVVLLARAGLDDASCAGLTEGLFRMLPQLSAELPFLKGMDPERAPATPVPLHPGAALYYRERELQAMIPRPRALVAEPSTWLAALICCGLCALAWFGYRATDQWQRSAALLADHRGHEAADLLTRALTRDMSGVQTSILNSPEQNRHAFDPPYEANDLVALAFARYPYPEFFFGWTPSSGGTVMFARTDRLPVWLTRARASRRLSRRGPARSAGNRGAAAADRVGRRRTAPLLGIRHVDRRGSATRSSRSSPTKARPANGSTVSSASPSTSTGRATTISTTSCSRSPRSRATPAPHPSR